jgi:hypothetical protein
VQLPDTLRMSLNIVLSRKDFVQVHSITSYINLQRNSIARRQICKHFTAASQLIREGLFFIVLLVPYSQIVVRIHLYLILTSRFLYSSLNILAHPIALLATSSKTIPSIYLLLSMHECAYASSATRCSSNNLKNVFTEP